MEHDLEQAREALNAGDVDQALVLLWKAVEPARLDEDEDALEEIASLAQRIPGREAADLLKATGVEPAAEAEAVQPSPKEPTRSRLASLLWVVVLLVLMAMIGLAYTRGGAEVAQSRPVGLDPVRVPIGAGGLHLVPLGKYPQDELTDVGLSVIQETGAVDIKFALGMGPTTYDAERGQFVAEELLRRLAEAFSIETDQEVLVVGVTSLEMYERARPEPAASVARTPDGRYVVVSTHDFETDPEVRKARLREILLEEIHRAGL
jgi:hypothetical protein